MKEKYLSVINKVSVYLTLLLAFLLPVFYLPFTVEYFEFNKLALTAVFTIALISLWALKMLIEGKVEITKAPINLPIILLTLSYALSTYFSLSKSASVFGSYGRWNNSLIVMVLSTLLYFAISSNLTSKEVLRKILGAFVLGVSLSSVVALLSFFRIYLLPASYAKLVTFTLTGSPTSAAAIAALAVVILMGEFMGAKTSLYRSMISLLMILNFILVSIVGAFGPWILLIVGLVSAFLITPFEKIKQSKLFILSLLTVLVAVGVVLTVPSLRLAARVGSYPTEMRLDLRSSWIVATSSLRDFPIFGSGPSTFYLNFSHYRPLSLNNTQQWNLRYDKAFNEYLDIASTLGVVGLLAYVFLMIKVFKLIKITDLSTTNVALSSAIFGMLGFFLVDHSFVILNVLFFMLLALLVSYMNGRLGILSDAVVESAVISFAISGKSTTVTTKTVSIMFSLPLFLLAVVGAYAGFRAYAAEIMMRNSIMAATNNKASTLFESQKAAIKLNPYVDSYHSSFAQTSFVLANSIAGSKKAEELTDEDKNNVKNLIASAIQETRINTELLNPTNPAAWEQRGKLYSMLTGIAKDADSWSAGSYTRAIELDPTNAALRLSLGGVFYSAKSFDIAERHFRAAVALKSDYANAHYNLAQALREQKKYPEAVAEMQTVLSLIPKNTPDYTKADSELTALKNVPSVAGAQTTKPSVTDLQPAGKTQTSQEPLTKPDETKKPTITDTTTQLQPAQTPTPSTVKPESQDAQPQTTTPNGTETQGTSGNSGNTGN